MSDYVKLKGRPKIRKIKPTEDGRLKIVWTEVEGAEKYAVLRKDEPDGEFEHIKWRKKLSFVDEVEKDKTYWYKIMASKTLEGKKKSTKESAARSAIISDIAPVENLFAEGEDGHIVLTWDKVSDADGYIINRKNAFCSQMLPVAETKKCRFVDKKVVSGQVYHYSVQSIVKDGDIVRQGNFSQKVKGVYLDCGEILSAKVSGKKVNLSLRIVAGADGYIIERCEGKDGEFSEIARTQSNVDIYFCDKAERHFKAYSYRIRAYKNVKDSEFISEPSKAICVKTK